MSKTFFYFGLIVPDWTKSDSPNRRLELKKNEVNTKSCGTFFAPRVFQFGLPVCAGLVGTNMVQDVCRKFQLCTLAQTSPTPGLTLTLWGARGR